MPGAARAGVAWIAKSLGFVGRRLVNLRGRVEAGTTEALEGGRSKNGRAGWEWWLDDARTSLKRLLAGVALTWTVEAWLGFLSSARGLVPTCSMKEG